MPLSAAEIEDLRRAQKLLEHPGLAIKLTNLIGSPIEKGMALLPKRASGLVNDATSKALRAALRIAVLTMRKGGEKPIEFLLLEMSNVAVSSFSTGGSGGEDRLTENVTLHFDRIRGSYRQQLPDGSAGPEVTFDIVGGCPQ